MKTTAATVAAPPSNGPFPAWGWVLLCVVGVLFVIAAIAPFIDTAKNKRIPVGQQERNFRNHLHTAYTDRRGYVRLTPAHYPGLTTRDAEQVAAEEGFFRQAPGSKENWLFRREASADFPPQSPSAEATAEDEQGPSKAQGNSDARIMGGTLLLLAGTAATAAHVTNWANGNMLDCIEAGDGTALAITHLLNVLALVGAFRLLRGRRLRR